MLGLRSPRWAEFSEVLGELRSNGPRRLSPTLVADQLYLSGRSSSSGRRVGDRVVIGSIMMRAGGLTHVRKRIYFFLGKLRPNESRLL